MKFRSSVVAAAVLLAACSAPEPRPRTIAEFVADPILLQGVIARCRVGASSRDPECANALAAANRIADEEIARRAAERQAQFEALRGERRAREEEARRAEERATPRFDPYSAPVTLEPPAPAAAPGASANPTASTSR